MALKMMELSEEVLTPDGKPIKVNFHSSFAMNMFIVAAHVLGGNIAHSKIQQVWNTMLMFIQLT